MRTALLVGASAVALAVLGWLAWWQLSENAQSHVEVERVEELADEGSLDRSDELGADTVRAYLEAAIDCSRAGDGMVLRLSAQGPTTYSNATALQGVFARACGDITLITADAVKDLDPRGRALWKLQGEGLPDDLAIRVIRERGAWVVERSCSASSGCPPERLR